MTQVTLGTEGKEKKKGGREGGQKGRENREEGQKESREGGGKSQCTVGQGL